MANPINTQPQLGGPNGAQMPPPSGVPSGVPPGLEYLAMLDQIVVKQKIELLQVLVGVETNNQYIVKNSMGQQIYRVLEDTDLCMRLCCGPSRGFTLHVVDNFNQVVMLIKREFHCCQGCCWCANSDGCAFLVSVEAPPGNVIGYTKQAQSCWKIFLDVLDEKKQTIFKVRGPCCPCGCSDINFPVYDTNLTREVCMVTKQWSGCGKECLTGADNFGIQFPMDLDVKMKATLMGTLFLIDFMAFEKNQNENNN